jgi:hypothetical protein
VKTIIIKAEATPEDIMKQLNIEGAYLVLEGLIANAKIIKRIIRDGSTFYACSVQDRG